MEELAPEPHISECRKNLDVPPDVYRVEDNLLCSEDSQVELLECGIKNFSHICAIRDDAPEHKHRITVTDR